MIDRAFSSRYRWARRGQRQCVFCACSPGQRSVGGAAHRSGIVPGHRAALVSGDRLQTIAECPFDPRLTPCTATRRSPRCCAATGSRGGTDPAASPTASPPPARITAGVPARRVPGHRAGRGAHRTTHRTPRRTGPGPAAPAPHPGPARRRPLPLLPPATPPPTMTRPGQPRPTGSEGRRRRDADAGHGPHAPASGRPSSCTGVAPDAGAGTGRRVPAGVTPGVGRMARCSRRRSERSCVARCTGATR